MATTKKSVFRDFIKALRAHWSSALPSVQLVKTSYGPTMPKASTFYAGLVPDAPVHVFLRFQHHSKSWYVGQFTVNVILSKVVGPPTTPLAPWPDKWKEFIEGSYRIGPLLGGKDKWWCLLPDESGSLGERWRATDYSDATKVLNEAVADVTRDVIAALDRLGMAAPPEAARM